MKDQIVLESRYSFISRILHWGMLVQLALVYACIELRDLFPKGSDLHQALKTWHFMLGLSVLVFVLLRLIARLSTSVPEIEPAPPKWQLLSAKGLHLSLYILMIFLPLAGWAILSAAGKLIPFFGLQLPALIEENKDLAKQIKNIHETMGTVGYFLIGIHASAGLYHHYVMRDNTLVRMLPGE